METVSIQNIFNYLPRSIRQDVSDDDQILSWTYQGMRRMNFRHTYEVKRMFIGEAVDHKVKTPQDMGKIISIFKTDPEDTRVFMGECCREELPENHSFACPAPLMHRYWQMACDRYPNPRIRLVGMRDKRIICNGDHTCGYEASYDPEGCYLNTDFKSGQVSITYWGTATIDEDPVLPKEPPELWLYLRSYVMHEYFLERSISDPSVINQMNIAKADQSQYAAVARGRLVLSSVSPKNHPINTVDAFLMAPSNIRNMHSIL